MSALSEIKISVRRRHPVPGEVNTTDVTVLMDVPADFTPSGTPIVIDNASYEKLSGGGAFSISFGGK